MIYINIICIYVAPVFMFKEIKVLIQQVAKILVIGHYIMTACNYTYTGVVLIRRILLCTSSKVLLLREEKPNTRITFTSMQLYVIKQLFIH